MLENIRSALAKRALRQSLEHQHRKRQIHTIESARSIAVLFDATDNADRKEVLEFVKSLEQQKKQVRLLGYIDAKQVADTPAFDYFFRKDLRWNGQINSEKAHAFSEAKPDLLLCFNPDQNIYIARVAVDAAALMKIGYATELPNDFDILLEIPAGKGIRFFTEQLTKYLGKIVLGKNESARAI